MVVHETESLEAKAQRLIDAAEAGRLSEVKDWAMSGLGVNASNRFGETALMAAASSGELGVMEYLIEAGCDVDAESRRATRAVMCAAMSGRPESLRLLLAAGCKVDGVDKDRHGVEKDGAGSSALMYAVQESSYKTRGPNVALECVALLLSAGCDLDEVGVHGRTAWERAVVVDAKDAMAMISAEKERRQISKAVDSASVSSKRPRI